MVKETVSTSSRDSSIKKRRKNAPAAEGDAEVDIYKKVIEFEEKESLSRSADNDATVYFDTCKDIRRILADIYELKSQNTSENRAKIAEKCTQIGVFIAVLKKLNRLEKFRAITAREALSIEKQKADSTNLQYQNLMYEAAHMVSEFKKCIQFKSKDEDIELISIEEFLKEAPEKITAKFKNIKEKNDNINHELHLARLEYEFTQRKDRAELCNTFEDEKKRLAAGIIELKNRLDGLSPKLAAVLEATKPLQEHLGLPIDKIRAEHKLASLLPDPLYLLYANTDAYKQVYGLDMTVEILGNQDDALQWKQLQEGLSNQADDSEQENDQQEVEEAVEIKKRRHRKASQADRHEEKKKRLLEGHPLAVQVTLKIKNGPVLKLQFCYRVQLNILTVTSTVDTPNNITGHAAKEVLSGDSLLGELFEGDFGLDSPNPCNNYQLQKVGFGSFQTLVPKIGYAYSWAQKVCGLDFLATQNSRENANKLSQGSVENVMKTLNKRLQSRSTLASQLQQLEQNLIPIIPDNVELPRNAVATLTNWVPSTWQSFCSSISTAALVEADIVGPSDLFYAATISRPKAAVLHALIAIKNNYPQKSPIFSLTLKYNGEHHAGNCDEIRDMERAINVGWDQGSSSAGWLLAAQLRFLCAFLDVYLESSSPSNFPQNTVFFKNICARNRRRPFKFRKLGSGVFIQY